MKRKNLGALPQTLVIKLCFIASEFLLCKNQTLCVCQPITAVLPAPQAFEKVGCRLKQFLKGTTRALLKF
ncbi:MAG: hypothetical protein ACK5LT_02220 [Lachnospirales bacterium]